MVILASDLRFAQRDGFVRFCRLLSDDLQRLFDVGMIGVLDWRMFENRLEEQRVSDRSECRARLEMLEGLSIRLWLSAKLLRKTLESERL